ncbi:Hachiman antiphage defense system protein HamA [Rossellomorea sp. LJF3]|uniref:Hachiman antiphage defense system protein HamA n=1 Tax=Rossellomorea sp. LJF3 TaxID=3126099 RepID=UPI00300CA5FB
MTNRNLYEISAKLYADEEATAFLISDSIALTAKHAVDKNIEENTGVTLQFFVETNFENNQVRAKVKNYNSNFDIAILELDQPCTHVTIYLDISNQEVESSDDWESVGYPINWSVSDEGSEFCYLKGSIYQISNLGSIYDLHLTSPYIKDEWDYGLKGLSGAPLIIDGVIKGVVVYEEYSLLRTPIKSISINKFVQFLTDNGITTGNNFGPKSNLVNKRLNRQKIKCEDLFKKVEYNSRNSEVNISINSYHVNYDDNGLAKVKHLSDYLASSIIDYAFTLEEIHKSRNSDTNKEMFQLMKRTNQVIEVLKESNEFGSILLWMILEGVIGAPKAVRRLSIKDEEDNIYNEAHIGVSSEQKLILYLGNGLLENDFKTGINNSMEVLKRLLNVQDDVYVVDDYFYEQIGESPIRQLLTGFDLSHTRDWDNVTIELNVFGGYDSKTIKEIESKKLNKRAIEKFIEAQYVKECLENEEYICEKLTQETEFKHVKVNWFILPFNTIKDFERIILDELTEEGSYR